MTSKEFALTYLLAVEKKNQNYFTENNLKIMDCVTISENGIVSVHIINKDLPYEIIHEIETMFWI